MDYLKVINDHLKEHIWSAITCKTLNVYHEFMSGRDNSMCVRRNDKSFPKVCAAAPWWAGEVLEVGCAVHLH